jgi:hypothetical protein
MTEVADLLPSGVQIKFDLREGSGTSVIWELDVNVAGQQPIQPETELISRIDLQRKP